VDDRLMGITHVIRAEEWITSTPKHVVLYGAFGWEPPEFVHLPLLRNKDKSKISKRKNPVSLLYYRQIGILPQTMLNFLALLGHSMPGDQEIFELDEFQREFSFDRISLGGPVFDVEKLLWLNGMRIRAMTDAALADSLRESVFSRENLIRQIPLARERMRTLGDFAEVTSFFHLPSIKLPVADLVAAGKGRAPKEMADLLGDAIERLDALRVYDKEAIEACLRVFSEQKQVPTGEFFMMLRVSLTGRKATPPLVESMVVLGRACVTQRLRAAAEALKVAKPSPA
jgi:glutamyl-tRNA synthetase